MSRGLLLFVGCGPGTPDLLTVRAVRALQAADVVIWNVLLLDRQALAEHTRADAEILQWPPATAQDILAVFDRAVAEDLTVVRLKGGDPTIFGQLEPELSGARERGLECEIVPGVTALGATAAALGREVAAAGTPVLLLDAAKLPADGAEAGVVAAWTAGRDPLALQRWLLARGLAPSTTCTVAIEVGRRDQTLIACPLEELGETIQDMAHGSLALVIADLDAD